MCRGGVPVKRPGRLAALVLAVLAAAPAQATASGDKPSESVTVTGTRSRAVIHKFVKNLAAPARVSGKITRWQDGICPQVVGLRPSAVKFVEERLRKVAAEVGAPVNAKPHCTVNIEIVFTTTPQAMIDHVREKRPELLGYADNQDRLAALAMVTRPIQAWYLTQTRDLHSNIYLDIAHRRGPGLEIPCGGGMDGVCYLPDAIATHSSGTRLGNGMRSEFHHVIVVADPSKLTDYPIGQLADTIALVALSHVNTPAACQPLASILNLLVPGCADIPDGLSANDMAYLHGLYRRMGAGLNPGLQRQEIANQIEDEATGR
jgi:hypothetical protein